MFCPVDLVFWVGDSRAHDGCCIGCINPLGESRGGKVSDIAFLFKAGFVTVPTGRSDASCPIEISQGNVEFFFQSEPQGRIPWSTRKKSDKKRSGGPTAQLCGLVALSPTVRGCFTVVSTPSNNPSALDWGSHLHRPPTQSRLEQVVGWCLAPR